MINLLGFLLRMASMLVLATFRFAQGKAGRSGGAFWGDELAGAIDSRRYGFLSTFRFWVRET